MGIRRITHGPHPFDLRNAADWWEVPIGKARRVSVTAAPDVANRWVTAGSTLTLYVRSASGPRVSVAQSIPVGGGDAHLDADDMPPGAEVLVIVLGTANAAEAWTNLEVTVEEEEVHAVVGAPFPFPSSLQPSAQPSCGCSH